MAAPLRKCLFTFATRNNRKLICRKELKNYCTKSIRTILLEQRFEESTCIKGWVRSVQQHKGVTFLHINDGSGPKHIQVIVPPSLAEKTNITFGSCVKVEGILKESQGKGQSVELLSTSVDIIGPCDALEFPVKQRTRHPPQYLRDFLHIRPKTNSFGALLRIRNAASIAVHRFFQENNYVFIHTPILTSSDCEGACAVFKAEPLLTNILSSSDSERDDEDDRMTKGSPEMSNADERLGTGPRPSHFFRQPAYLTVSGQLHLEVMTGGFTKVYNFGPTFRAENAHGSLHLSEFYMVEAELAFLDRLDDLLNVMENLVKYVCKSVMDECEEDFAIFRKSVAPSQRSSKVKEILKPSYERITYTNAIDVLKNSSENFQFEVFWGCDLKKEHEMYLTKALGNVPVFVTDYPAEIKPFYARRNDDSSTVAASDLLVPDVGELCGSSLREERADVLEQVMIREGQMEQIPWYLELRKFGTCPHGGFGMGFERLLLAMLGADSLKDVIPFPRWPRNCRT